MASTITPTLLTFEEFENLPDEPGKSELLDGELIQLPPAEIDHMDISLLLYDTLRPIVQEAGPAAGLGKVYHETGYQLGPRAWLVPDVSITHANQARTKYLQGAPALALEVISPSNSAEQVDRKIEKYLANGAREVWVFYPKTRRVQVHRKGQIQEFRGELRSELIPGLRIDLEPLFG